MVRTPTAQGPLSRNCSGPGGIRTVVVAGGWVVTGGWVVSGGWVVTGGWVVSGGWVVAVGWVVSGGWVGIGVCCGTVSFACGTVSFVSEHETTTQNAEIIRKIFFMA
ncbi:MAG: hypothetical protein QF837_05875 [Acidimicrobiales bacterium]|nr:hypothetical protein [Acidimicrobiales bacterium]